MKAKILDEPVLVGREHELEELQTLMDSAKAGRGTTVFVCGEAGAGKTRLVNEFLKQARKQEVTILTGWCLSNAAVPYFPFFEAFNKYFSTEHETKEIEVKSWLIGPPQTEKLGNPQTVTPQVWKDQTFTAVANTLASISTKHTVILFIDDLHWADSASLALIHYLGNMVASEKVLVIGTLRSEQLAVDNEGRPHPLVETLRLMRRQDLVKEINVKTLDEGGVSRLAKNMLEGSIQKDLAQKLSEESQGNPLFVVESLRMLHERNGLIKEGDQWRLTSDAIGIPPKIKDIILQRLGSLVRSQRNILDAASIIGEKFDPDLIASMLSLDQIEVIRVLDLIAKQTSLVRCDGELYRFDHGRTRDAIYDDISPALKKVYHGKAADWLERTNGEDELPLSDLAYQFAQAGNKEKAVKYALAAGQDALAKWSNTEAAKHFAFVVQAVEQNPRLSQERIIALEGLGDAYYASNSFQQAISTFEQLADIQTGASKLRALRKASYADYYQGNLAKQKELIQKASEVATADRLEAARLLHLKFSVVQSAKDWLAAGTVYQEVLQVYDEEYALSDAAYILLWLGFGQAMVGELESGVAFALRSIALYDELGDFRSQMEAYAYAGGTLQACTFEEEANRMFAKAAEVNERYKIRDYVRLFPAYVWEALGLIGKDVPSAVSKALKALEYFEKTDSYLYAGAVYGILIMSHALAGDTKHVDEYYGKLMSLPKHILTNAPSQIYFAPMLGTYYAAKNEFEKSNKAFTDWLAVINSTFQSPFVEAGSKQFYAWSLGKQGRLEEANIQLAEAQRIVETAKQRFSHFNIKPNIMTLTRPEATQVFPFRLDLINVSATQGSIVKVENLPREVEIVEISPNCIIHEGQIEFKDSNMKPFELKTAKLTLKATKPAETENFQLNPKITFINDLGETKTCNPRPVTITIQSSQTRNKSPAPNELFEPSPESDSEIDIVKRFGLPRTTEKT